MLEWVIIPFSRGSSESGIEPGSPALERGFFITEPPGKPKRWQEYTEELYKTDFHNPDNHDGVITHLEPDFLECEVK